MFNIFKRTDLGFNNIPCNELESIIKNTNGNGNYEILDVRTDREYLKRHIPESKLYNLMDPAFSEKISNLNRDKTYYVYCRSGSRSMSACRLMVKLGFKNVNNIKNGLMRWNGPLVYK